MNFKKWLNESPDEVKISNYDKSLLWTSGRTFSLFDQYALLPEDSDRFAVTHDVISYRLKDFYEKLVEARDNKITAQDLNKMLTSLYAVSDPWAQGRAYVLESLGNITKKAIKIMINVAESIADTNASYRNDTGDIRGVPEAILGRIWANEKVVSFWGASENVLAQTNNILNFVKHFGSPDKYRYEIEEQLLSYNELLKKHMPVSDQEPKNKMFDPATVHTMAPGEVKIQIQRMMGMTPGKQIDIKNKQLAQTSESKKHRSYY